MIETSHENAKVFKIPIGSCFVLPANYYHVGRSAKGVSAVIALAFSKLSSHLQIASVFDEIKRATFSIEDIDPYWTDFSHGPNTEETKAINETFSRRSYEDWLNHARARARSNGWLAEIQNLDIPKFPAGSFRFTLSPMHPPQFLEDEQGLYVYVKGHSALIDCAECKLWIEELCSGGEICLTADAIITGVKRRDKKMILASWLIATGGATITLSEK